MLAQRVCSSRTIRRLSDGEFRAFVAALCLAAQSPERGCLLVAEGEPVTVAEIAEEAPVEVDVAESMVSKLRRFGTLADDGPAGSLRFVKWSDFNPAPRASDRPAATRERKRRQRQRDREADDREAKAETLLERVLAANPESGRKRDRERYTAALAAYIAHLWPGLTPDEFRRWAIARDRVQAAIKHGGARDDAAVLAYIEERA